MNLDVLISMGLIGLLIFLVIYLFIPCYYFFKTRAYFSLALFLCSMLCLFTENMFDRYQGEIILAFILPLGVNIAFEKTNSVD